MNPSFRYQTGLATRESDTRKTLVKPKKKPICMLLRLQQVGDHQAKCRDSKEYHPLVKVCGADTNEGLRARSV